jgi:Rad3-related DNA helicase
MNWNLYRGEKFLKPLCFSNGKDQNDVVKEILGKIDEGKKIIFVHGVCGTGKSAIALNLASHLGKSSIVVPGKNLQTQYKQDYEGDKYLVKPTGERLKISVITGRRNHVCKFLEDSKESIPVIKKEVNANLHDIFSGKKEEVKELIGDDLSADNIKLPCKIEIREANWPKIKEYLKKNPKVDLKNFGSIKDVKRFSVAPVCPYWSPVLPNKYDVKSLDNVKKREYEGLDGVQFIQYKRKAGCPFYEQFNSYIDSDVVVFNSMKYLLETALYRKPKTEMEIIDECDLFLDSFSNESKINVERLQMALIQALGAGEGDEDKIEELLELLKHFKQDARIEKKSRTGEIIPLKSTGIYDIFKIFLKENWLKSVDDESYLFSILETARMFVGFMDESYITTDKKENSLFVNVVTTNLAKRFKQLVEKNKVLVLMSGTIHSPEVLKNIFGLEDFVEINAETKEQGKVEIMETGFEMDCKYSNFSSGNFTREDYLISFDKCLEKAPRPTLVHVNAFQDLPSDSEIEEYELNHFISREKFRELQAEDRDGKLVKKFKDGEMDILFSTRDSRGIDFPGKQCNSIVFTKYPNPNIDNPFWKILMKTKPNYYWGFYRDKARREFLQKIYRGLRFKEDHVYLLSPDSRVLEKAKEEF